MDKIVALRTFVTAVDDGGFTAAAKAMNTSASTVTRVIAALEAELGTVLINRTARQMTLTDAGSRYLQRAREVLACLQQADDSVNDCDSVIRGRLRVSLPMDFARCIVTPALGRFLRSHSQLDLSLSVSEEAVDLISPHVDVAVRLGHYVHNPNIVVRKIGKFQRWVVASPDYLLQHSPIELPEDLCAHGCLLFEHKTGGHSWTFTGSTSEQRIAVSGPLRSNNIQMLRQACLGGAGIALLPEWNVKEDVAAGRLARLFLDFSVSLNDLGDSINLVYLSDQKNSARAAAFSSYLEREMLNFV